jgi:acyl-CoA dehydrogenase
MAQEARLVMELGYTTPAFRSLFGTNNGIAGHVLLEGGTVEQRKEYLPRLATGEWTASFALTEAEAGSDPSGRHDEQAAATRDISVFLVPKDAPGLSVGPKDNKMGQPGAWTAEVFLDDVPVPDEALVGGQDGHGTGYLTAMRCLAHGRLHIAAEFQLVQGLIADSQTDVYAARALVLSAATPASSASTKAPARSSKS